MLTNIFNKVLKIYTPSIKVGFFVISSKFYNNLLKIKHLFFIREYNSNLKITQVRLVDEKSALFRGCCV